jgi:hypothetical protein
VAVSETSVLSILVAVTFALVGVVWGLLRASITAQEKAIAHLTEQNTAQEVALGRLSENARSREDIHAQHREDVSAWVGRLETQIGAINGKLDRILSQGRYGTPMPSGRYGSSGEGRGG